MQISDVLVGVLSPTSVRNVEVYGRQFRAAKPYRHILIDEFLEQSFAKRLLSEFPSFAKHNAVNEMGEVGGKAVVEAMRDISPAFAEADNLFSSQAFLEWASKVTGIPDLLYDSQNFGGGTHENIDGQDLLPHVDFNIHPATGRHRRVNLIVYLNEGWRREWGGAIQVHSNPREPQENVIASYEPLFNRAIIFETNEYSWHGFDPIRLPADQKNNSRKSVSIYLYTADRPPEETAGTHATFYVPRPLSFDLQPGQALGLDQIHEIRQALTSREKLIEIHQKREAQLEGVSGEISHQLAEMRAAAGQLRLPISGYARQVGEVRGFYADGWSDSHLEFQVKATRAIDTMTIRARLPEQLPSDARISVLLDGSAAWEGTPEESKLLEITVGAHIAEGTIKTIALACSDAVNLAQLGAGEDNRSLSTFIEDIVFDRRREPAEVQKT